jgi:hypothetical protein
MFQLEASGLGDESNFFIVQINGMRAREEKLRGDCAVAVGLYFQVFRIDRIFAFDE